MRPGSRAAVGAASLLAWAGSLVSAQVVPLDKVPVPEVFTMSTHYLFYVYAKDESLDASTGEQPRVEFQGLSLKPVPGKAATAGLKKYAGVQVVLLPYDHFWTIVKKDRFCTTIDDVLAKKASQPGTLLLQKTSAEDPNTGVQTISYVEGGMPQDVRVPIQRTGRYLLVFSNCGNISEATISGKIAVRNAHGFLPGNEYYAMTFFGVMTALYAIMNIAWVCVLLRYLKDLTFIQVSIAGISFTAFLDSGLAWVEYKVWNTTGVRPDAVSLGRLLFYTLKIAMAWRLVIIAAMGSGIKFEELSTKASAKLFFASTIFMIQQSLWKMIMNFRFTYSLSTGFLIGNIFPGAVVYAAMFGWFFAKISTLLVSLEEKGLSVGLKAFQASRTGMLVALAMASFVTLMEIIDCASGSMFPWSLQWFTAEGASTLALLLLIALFMLIWMPSKDSWKSSYQQTSGADAEGLGIAGAEGDGPDTGDLECEPMAPKLREEEEEPLPRAKPQQKPSAVAPQEIGASSQRLAEEGPMLL